MKTRIFSKFIILLSPVLIIFPSFLYAGELQERVKNARMVLNETMNIPDKGIPYDLFHKSRAIAIFPHVIKGGFVVGGKYGKGIISVHDEKTGMWSPPAFFSLVGGSYGLQAGVQAIDLVLLITTKRGFEGLLKSSVKLGVDIGIAAGPVGRRLEAGTDILLKAEILSYSRSKGLFAGISLEGATLIHNDDDNRIFYGKKLSARDILLEGKADPPPVAKTLITTLKDYSSAN